MVASMTRADRFWSKVDTSDGLFGCWIWTASRFTKRGGYGQFHEWPKVRYAHRVAWELTHGPIPDGMVVMHACDNPPCVNPQHLSLGTIADNAQDMVAKGRSLKGARSPGYDPAPRYGRFACGHARPKPRLNVCCRPSCSRGPRPDPVLGRFPCGHARRRWGNRCYRPQCARVRDGRTRLAKEFTYAGGGR